jgi:uncharacterized membrane protein YccC
VPPGSAQADFVPFQQRFQPPETEPGDRDRCGAPILLRRVRMPASPPSTVSTPRGLRRRLLAADPGLQRTLFAARTTLSVAVTLALAFPLARAGAQPPTVPLLAVSVAMIAATAIIGVTRGEQLRSAGFVALVAAAAVALGALLAPYPLLGYAAFVAVMAAAAWAGGFGPGGRGLGMVGFMTFFFALFTRATLDRLPWLLLAVGLGAAVAGAMRVVVLRDPPGRRLRHLVVALRARLQELADHAEQVRAGTWTAGDARARLADDSVRIDEVVLPLHDLLRDTPDVIPRERAFRGHLFAVVTLSHLLVLRALEGRSAPAAALAAPLDPAERLEVHLAALEAAAAGRPEPSISGARTLVEGDDEPEPTPEPAAEPVPLWARGSPRTALQVAAAGAVAIAVGHLLSPHRWYWAGIAAFIVFVNTTSRGATLRRAVERMLGTAAGIAGGLLAGYLLAGRSALELLVIFPVLFVGYWMFEASQVAMVGMITVLFALMYDLMGMLTLHLMLLRLAETVVGAAAGAAAAYFILPARTRTALDEAFAGYFGAMDGVLQAVAAAPSRTGQADRALLEGVQGLDRAVGTLRAAIQPLIASVPGHRSRGLQRQLVLALTARYWVNRLVARLLFHTHDVDAATLRERVERVRARIATLREGQAVDPPPIATVMAVAADAMEGAPLIRAEAVLAELARARAGQS